jgi:RIO kinase 1
MDAHMIDQVVGQLQSGKEADLFVVISEGEYRCAKVYKDATNRSFKQKSDYTEGRSVRNSRQARAMNKNSKFGRQEREREWQTAEVEALAMLASAGVKLPASTTNKTKSTSPTAP